jgi:hypothetical protein
MLDHQPDAHHAAADSRSGTSLYRRRLPGGGYVEMELDPRDATDASPGREGGRSRGRVIVERRADVARRVGHQPPVVAELEGQDRTALAAELFQLVQDNAALARGVMRWQSAHHRAD